MPYAALRKLSYATCVLVPYAALRLVPALLRYVLLRELKLLLKEFYISRSCPRLKCKALIAAI